MPTARLGASLGRPRVELVTVGRKRSVPWARGKGYSAGQWQLVIVKIAIAATVWIAAQGLPLEKD